MSKQQKAKKPPKKKPTLEARYSWDNGEYARDQTLRLILPWQFLFMCKLTDVTPDTVIDRFMNDLGQESWKRRENDAVRQTLVDYFVLCGYGQKWYTEPEIRQMFRELDAIGSLWPENGGIKLIHRHARWKERYQAFWFKKWYRKLRRKP
jgi:hypothetical protein